MAGHFPCLLPPGLHGFRTVDGGISGNGEPLSKGQKLPTGCYPEETDMNTMPLKVDCEFAGVGQQLLHIDCHEDTAFGRGHVHQRPCSHPWLLLFAAYDGCKDCARASMEDAHLVPTPLRGFYNYISACFAMSGAEASYDTMWVQGFFAGKGVIPESGVTTFACSISHVVACSPDHQGQPCKLFSAAYHGCRVRSTMPGEGAGRPIRSGAVRI